MTTLTERLKRALDRKSGVSKLRLALRDTLDKLTEAEREIEKWKALALDVNDDHPKVVPLMREIAQHRSMSTLKSVTDECVRLTKENAELKKPFNQIKRLDGFQARNISDYQDNPEAIRQLILSNERLYVLEAKLRQAQEALNSVIAKSRSWVITQETGAIQMPIHDGYRALAEKALKEIGD